MTKPLLSVIIPTFNEEDRIGATLEQVIAYLRPRSYDWEVVVADDGSTDRTVAIVAQLSKWNQQVRLVQAPHSGKGSALRHGIAQAKGEYFFLCDADLSMPIHHLIRFLPPALEEYDLAVGSRRVPGARRFREPHLRHFQGRIFNGLVRLLVMSTFTDTQCGFKCLQASAALQLLPLLRVNGFSFDVELLFLAKQQGLRIVEVPIDWVYRERSRVRFFIDAIRMLGELISIRWNHILGRYRGPMPAIRGSEPEERV